MLYDKVHREDGRHMSPQRGLCRNCNEEQEFDQGSACLICGEELEWCYFCADMAAERCSLTGEVMKPDDTCEHFDPVVSAIVPQPILRTRSVPLVIYPQPPPRGIEAALRESYPQASHIGYQHVLYHAGGLTEVHDIEITEEVLDG